MRLGTDRSVERADAKAADAKAGAPEIADAKIGEQLAEDAPAGALSFEDTIECSAWATTW